MTSHLEAVPREIFIHGIFNYLALEDLKNLRFTSKILSSTVAMVLFRCLQVIFEKGTELDTRVEQLLDASRGGNRDLGNMMVPPQIKTGDRVRLRLSRAIISSQKRKVAMAKALQVDGINKLFGAMPNLSKVSFGSKSTESLADVFKVDLFKALSPSTNPLSKITKFELDPISRHAFSYHFGALDSNKYGELKLALSGFTSMSFGVSVESAYQGHSRYYVEVATGCTCTGQTGTTDRNQVGLRLILGALSASTNLQEFSIKWLDKQYKVVGKRRSEATVSDPFHCLLANFNRYLIVSFPAEEEGENVQESQIVLVGDHYVQSQFRQELAPQIPLVAWPEFEQLQFTNVINMTFSSFILRTRSIDAFVHVIAKHLGHLERLNISDATLHNFQHQDFARKIIPVCFPTIDNDNIWTISWEDVFFAIQRAAPSPRIRTPVVHLGNLRHALSTRSWKRLWELKQHPRPYGDLINDRQLRWFENLLQSDDH